MTKQWFAENSDKILLLVAIMVFFGGAFVSAKMGNSTIPGAAVDNMKFVLGALVGLITGIRIASGGPENPTPPPIPVGK